MVQDNHTTVLQTSSQRIGWLVGVMVFNGTFSTKRLSFHAESKSMLKILISDKK